MREHSLWVPHILLVLSASVLLSCQTSRLCRDKTLFLSISFDARTQAADSLAITVTLGGQARHLTPIPRRQVNRSTDSVELQLDDYSPGPTVIVSVDAIMTKPGAKVVLGSSSIMAALKPGCTSMSLAFSATDGGSDTPPLGDGGDTATDGSGGDVACTPGAVCTLADNPCHVGRTTCTDGVAGCQDTQSLQGNGTACGAGMVCAAGTCVACSEGSGCDRMQPCKVGSTSCSTGSPVCMESGNADDGSMCGTGMGMVCSSGACVQCMAGTACTPTNACHKGTLACDGGTSSCNDTGQMVTDGAPCGAGHVCFQGSCQACVASAACDVPDQPCRTGLVACNTGKPVCVDSANAANGKTCDTGKVCNNGSCASCVENDPCTPANKCHVGKLSCGTGTPVCVDTQTAVDNGASCGVNQVCNGGNCASCLAGQDCTPASTTCRVGKTSCASGTSLCVQSGNAPPGSTCGSGLVCDANGACVACSVGACVPTQAPCHNGMLSCAGGTSTCMDLGTSIGNGTGCGQDRVCKAGSCVSCKAGDICQPNGNLCENGVTACDSGSSVCMKTGNASDGKGCGAGQVCKGGVCVTCMDGTPCTPPNAPCHKGTQSCATGSPVCTDTNAPADNGTVCGANLACAGGSCSCTQGTSCPVANMPCKTGTTSCSTGASVCNPTGDVANGSTCAAGKQCMAGGCVANPGCGSSPAENCPCATASMFGCAGSKLLVCTTITGLSGLAWQLMSTCTATQTCDAGSGSCKTLAPDAPVIGTASVNGVKTALVNWTVPADNGVAIASYEVQDQNGVSRATASGAAANSATATGLTAGTAYTFKVRAINTSNITGPFSAASNQITAADKPGAPGSPSASLGAGRVATISWTAAAANGSAITGYTVREVQNRITMIAAGANATSAMTGALTAGVAYSFTVTATNALGDGPASAATAPVTPTCATKQRTIAASDSVSVQYGTSGMVAADDSVFAFKFSDVNSNFDITGWMKFDLTPIPAGAQVTALTLFVVAQATNQGSGPPTVQVLYSAADGWRRQDNPGPAAIPRTVAVSTPVLSGPAPAPRTDNFTINTASHDFSSDVADHALTLGVTGTTNSGYNLYFGSDPPAANQPVIQITTCE